MLADIWLTTSINSFAFQYSWLNILGIFLATYLPFILVAIFIILGFKNVRDSLSLKAGMPFRWLMLFEGFLAGFWGFFVAGVIGFLWNRPRPFVLGDVRSIVAHAASPAFPSTHASIFFALSTIVFLYNRKAGIWFFIASVIMSLARVFCGLHWFSDILAGMGIGIFIGLIVYYFPRRLFHIQ
ncbi:MAG: phosphatase PAP2 family protein [Candidatus Gribaldobacteria bacterium]|nr:phosphatase PAP2 family protein [Candidatus Gribaldobacteria bacterium]